MTLAGYVGQRLLLTAPVVLSVLTAIFLVVRVLPGDPAQVALGENASQAAVEGLRSKLGLNEPLATQYLRFLGGLVHGDLGVSMINGSPVREQIAYNLPFTLELSVVALVVGTSSGLLLGGVSVCWPEYSSGGCRPSVAATRARRLTCWLTSSCQG
jgi:ABC-type dipeptide/oligopeptide/nickel transport system permease component